MDDGDALHMSPAGTHTLTRSETYQLCWRTGAETRLTHLWCSYGGKAESLQCFLTSQIESKAFFFICMFTD